jgi:hemolysin activation/secretion protein
VSGERTWGTYPFFEAAFLGGTPTRSPLDVTGVTSGNLLRGYDLDRFAGDAAVVANTDLNVELGRWSAFLPLRYGVFGLFDVGRVFVDGESSSKWHNSVGGGVWMRLSSSSPFLQLAGSLRAALVHTEDGVSFFLASGFGL